MFLEAYLRSVEGSTGVWFDTSKAMLGIARDTLAEFGDRVTYVLGDMADLASPDLPSHVDVVTSSRASHHMSPEGLIGFYTQARALLRPGGWLMNLDHVGLTPQWNDRLRRVRRQFVPRRTKGSTHHHDAPLPTADDHVRALQAAGINDVEMPWRAFFTCLFVARTPPSI